MLIEILLLMVLPILLLLLMLTGVIDVVVAASFDFVGDVAVANVINDGAVDIIVDGCLVVVVVANIHSCY